MASELPTVAGYRVLRRIGRGGMGDVFEAVRVGPGGFRRPVALKQLALDDSVAAGAVQRFYREARVSAQLDHPNIVRVHDLLVEGERHFIAMDLLVGVNLAVAFEELRRAGQGPVPWWLPLGVADQVLDALAYAHALRTEAGRLLGLVHRDLTPRNLFLCESGVVKVLDFGIAKLSDGSLLTRTGHLQGTVEFLSPEQARSEPVDARTDLYQLGGTLYWALTGRFPNGTGTVAEVIARAAGGAPPPLAELRPDVPAAAAQVIARAIARDPAARWPDAAAMRRAVREALAGVDAGPAVLAGMFGSLSRPARAARPPNTISDVDLDEDGGLSPGSAPTVTMRPAGPTPVERVGPGPVAPARAAPARVEPTRIAPAPPPRRRARLAAIAAAAGVAVLAFAAGRLAAPREPDAPARAAPAPPRPRAEPPRWTRVTFRRGLVSSARFAPDGKFVYAAAWNGAPAELFLGTLGSAESRTLDLPRSEIAAVARSGEMAVLRDVVYQDVTVRCGTLARVSLAGGQPRAVLADVQWADFSPDGKELMVVRRVGSDTTMEYPVAHTIFESESGWVSEPRVSPAGDAVAMVRHPVPMDDRGEIALVLRSGQVRVLSPGWRSVQGLAWRGAEIWFTATKDGTSRELHAVTRTGAERLVARVPAGLVLEDIAPDGRALVRRESFEQSIAGGRGGGAPERDLGLFDTAYVFDMARDGSLVVMGDGGGDAAGAIPGAHVRPLDGPPVRLGDGNPLAITADNQTVLAIAPTFDKLLLLPVGPGRAREVAVPYGPIGLSGALFPDGKRALVPLFGAPGGQRPAIVDLATGRSELLPARFNVPPGNPISPDGRTLALFDQDGRVFLVPVAGGEARPAPGVQPGEILARFSADGRSLYVSPANGAPLTVTRVELASGRRRPWRTLLPGDAAGVTGIFTWVADARFASYAYTFGRRLTALYVADGLE